MSRVTKARKKPISQQQLGTPLDENIGSPGLFSDTNCSLKIGFNSWEYVYHLFKEEGPRVTQRTITVEYSTPVSNTTYIDVANSFLHRIVAWPKLLSYNDMIWWALGHVNILDIKFMRNNDTIIDSFSGSDFSAMCHLPTPRCKYDKQFLDNFMSVIDHPS